MRAAFEGVSPLGISDFDRLRAKLELDLPRPAVIALTSSTAEDGKEIVARALSLSFAAKGYKTLFLDTCLNGLSTSKAPRRPVRERPGRLSSPATLELTVLNLDDLALQRATSQRHIRSELQNFRREYDYVIVNAEYGDSTAFSASVVMSADAVLVTVKKGRREQRDDARLAAALERIGSRFLGVLALDPSLFPERPTAVPDVLPDWRRSQKVLVTKEIQRREIVESL